VLTIVQEVWRSVSGSKTVTVWIPLADGMKQRRIARLEDPNVMLEAWSEMR
jgi:hypothetical protein